MSGSVFAWPEKGPGGNEEKMDESKQIAVPRTAEERPQRIWFLDLLRILATFAIVVLHVSAQGWSDIDVRTTA